MEGQPRIEELLNKITFLRKALDYYGDNTTYACNNGIAPIDNDRGHQARFAIEQSEDIEKYNENLIRSYNEAVDSVKQQEDNSVIDQETLNKIGITLENYKKKYGNKG